LEAAPEAPGPLPGGSVPGALVPLDVPFPTLPLAAPEELLPVFPEGELPMPEELPIPELPEGELPMPEELPIPELLTSTPSALAVLSSMRPVAGRLLDFWNSRNACWVFGPRTPSSGPGSIPLLFRADWTSFTLSFDMRELVARRVGVLLWSFWVCISPLDEDGSLDFCEPAPVCDQACGVRTNTAPLNTRLDKTVDFFISRSFRSLKSDNKEEQWQ
jgi:hypothetical protein